MYVEVFPRQVKLPGVIQSKKMKLEPMHPNLPILLFCMTPDDFTHHWEHGFNISMIFKMNMQRVCKF